MGDEVAVGTDTVDAGLAAARTVARALRPHRGPRPMAMVASPVLDEDVPFDEAPFDEALQRSDDHPDRVISSPDRREGVTPFVERRLPRFAPLGPFPD